jgi:hypothetical protein
LGNFDLAVDGAKCSRILTHLPVNQNCTSNLNPLDLTYSYLIVILGWLIALYGAIDSVGMFKREWVREIVDEHERNLNNCREKKKMD